VQEGDVLKSELRGVVSRREAGNKVRDSTFKLFSNPWLVVELGTEVEVEEVDLRRISGVMAQDGGIKGSTQGCCLIHSSHNHLVSTPIRWQG
jgi:hypothetical protein